MTAWGSPARGAPGDERVVRGQPEGRALLVGRSVIAPLWLAVSTVAGVAGAVLALVPAAIRRRPVGRPSPRRAEDGSAASTASEPIAP